jgi:hypothetical protein
MFRSILVFKNWFLEIVFKNYFLKNGGGICRSVSKNHELIFKEHFLKIMVCFEGGF